MKKTASIILVLMLAFPLRAQFEQHEVSVSYGLVTIDQIADIFADVLISAFTLGNFEARDHEYSGAIFLNYRYGASYRWNVGLTAGIDRAHGNLTWEDEIEGTFRKNHTTIAAETDYRWVKKSIFELYSGIGIGYTFSNYTADLLSGASESLPSGHVTGQLNALGIRFGKRIGFYTELGFGYKGLLNFGASYKF